MTSSALQAVRPDPVGGVYRAANGDALMPVHYLIDRVHRPPLTRPERDNGLRQALVNFASTAPEARASWKPTGDLVTRCGGELQAMASHAMWSRFEVLHAPLHLRDPRRSLATTADLLVRFASDGHLGVGILQTAKPEQLNPLGPMAELGAAAAMVVDAHIGWLSRVFLVWLADGQLRLEVFKPDQVLPLWVDTVDQDAWMTRAMQRR
jgi:hypothetical protein